MQIHKLSQTAAAELLQLPGAIPWHIDGVNSRVLFRQLSEQALYDAPFVDQRITFSSNEALFAVPISSLLAHQHVPLRNSRWIFHTSFCCSTLLARLLQRPDDVLAIKEPLVFNQLADAYRQQPGNASGYTALLEKISLQLCKPFHPHQQVILKTSNYMNALLMQLQNIDQQSRVVIVWGGIGSFVRSMLKNRQEAVKTLPVFLRSLCKDIEWRHEYQPGNDFWRDIAYLWAAQIRLFSGFLQQQTLSAVTLSKDDIVNHPEQVVSACDRFFGIRDKRDFTSVSSVMNKDSKQQNNSPSMNSELDITAEQQNIAATESLAMGLLPPGALERMRANSILQ